MPSKKEYSDILNKVFGTSINWAKLTKEELVELATILNHPEVIIKNLGIDIKRDKLGDKLVITALEMWDGPFARLLKKLLDKEETKKEEKDVNFEICVESGEHL